MKTILILMVFIFLSVTTQAAIPAPVPGDGISDAWCDVGWEKDVEKSGKTIAEGLRDRLEVYNNDQGCRFLIYFLFSNRTITIKKPLVLENKLHDRGNGVKTGTYIDGYGTGGPGDKLGVVIDASALSPVECAFVVKGGFAARQQIHGITIIAASASQAICDENGDDLLVTLSSNCPGKTGGQCDFKDVTVLTPAPVVPTVNTASSPPVSAAPTAQQEPTATMPVVDTTDRTDTTDGTEMTATTTNDMPEEESPVEAAPPAAPVAEPKPAPSQPELPPAEPEADASSSGPKPSGMCSLNTQESGGGSDLMILMMIPLVLLLKKLIGQKPHKDGHGKIIPIL